MVTDCLGVPDRSLLMNWLSDWCHHCIDCWIGWLIDWLSLMDWPAELLMSLMDCLTDWVVAWLSNWLLLMGWRLFHWLIDRLTGPVDWLILQIGWVTNWLIDRLTDWLVDWLPCWWMDCLARSFWHSLDFFCSCCHLFCVWLSCCPFFLSVHLSCFLAVVIAHSSKLSLLLLLSTQFLVLLDVVIGHRVSNAPCCCNWAHSSKCCLLL